MVAKNTHNKSRTRTTKASKTKNLVKAPTTVKNKVTPIAPPMKTAPWAQEVLANLTLETVIANLTTKSQIANLDHLEPDKAITTVSTHRKIQTNYKAKLQKSKNSTRSQKENKKLNSSIEASNLSLEQLLDLARSNVVETSHLSSSNNSTNFNQIDPIELNHALKSWQDIALKATAEPQVSKDGELNTNLSKQVKSLQTEATVQSKARISSQTAQATLETKNKEANLELSHNTSNQIAFINNAQDIIQDKKSKTQALTANITSTFPTNWIQDFTNSKEFISNPKALTTELSAGTKLNSQLSSTVNLTDAMTVNTKTTNPVTVTDASSLIMAKKNSNSPLDSVNQDVLTTSSQYSAHDNQVNLSVESCPAREELGLNLTNTTDIFNITSSESTDLSKAKITSTSSILDNQDDQFLASSSNSVANFTSNLSAGTSSLDHEQLGATLTSRVTNSQTNLELHTANSATPFTHNINSDAELGKNANFGNNGNGGNGNNGTTISASQVPPPINPVSRSKFVATLSVLGLALSLFAVYKLYEPSLFSSQEVEKAKPSYVTVQTFNDYKTTVNQKIEVLQIKLSIMEQQLNNIGILAKLPSFLDNHTNNFSGNGINSSNINFNGNNSSNRENGTILNISSDQLRQILDNYVTYDRLNQILQGISHELTSSSLKSLTLNSDNNTINKGSNSTTPSAVPNYSKLATTSNSIYGAINQNLTRIEIQQVFNSLVESSTFKTYIGTLIAAYVASHPDLNKQQSQDLSQNIINQTVAEVNQQLEQIVSPRFNQLSAQVTNLTATVQGNKNNLGTVQSQVATNTQQIATNKENIATNLDKINTNRQAIINNQQVIDTNKSTSKETNASLSNLSNKVNTLAQGIKTNQDTATTLQQQINTNQANTQTALTQLYASARNILLVQNLQATQTEIANNANLRQIIVRLKVAETLATNAKIREAIIKDIDNLSAHTSSVQTPAVATQISTVIPQINQLPSVDASKFEEVSKANTDKSSFGQAVGSFFKNFVQVAKINPKAALNSTNLSMYLKENLHLSLQNALLALQTNNSEVYHNSLNDAISSLKTYYPSLSTEANSKVSKLIMMLDQLNTYNLTYNTHYQLESLTYFATTAPNTKQQSVTSPSIPSVSPQSSSPASK